MKQESKELISHLELKYGNNPKTPMQKNEQTNKNIKLSLDRYGKDWSLAKVATFA